MEAITSGMSAEETRLAAKVDDYVARAAALLEEASRLMAAVTAETTRATAKPRKAKTAPSRRRAAG